MSKKCTLLWREAHFEAKNAKKTTCSLHFWTLKRRFVWQAQKILYRFVAVSKTLAGVGL